nr:reverse transcriptase domain-containing protein [Tanacetum cinerariifolium]
MANLPLILSGAGPLKANKSENFVLTLGAGGGGGGVLMGVGVGVADEGGLMSSCGCDMHLMVLKLVVLLFFWNWVVVRLAEKTEVAAIDEVIKVVVKEHAWLSGENDSTSLARCYKTFSENYLYAFTHYEAWDVLKNHYKWCGVKAVVPKRHVRTAEDIEEPDELAIQSLPRVKNSTRPDPRDSSTGGDDFKEVEFVKFGEVELMWIRSTLSLDVSRRSIQEGRTSGISSKATLRAQVNIKEKLKKNGMSLNAQAAGRPLEQKSCTSRKMIMIRANNGIPRNIDLVKIHNTKQREGESTEAFMERFKAESMHVSGTPECMRILGFMHGITNPDLIKKLEDNISKSVDEMMNVTTAFLRGEVVVANQSKKKVPLAWRHHETSHKPKFDKRLNFKSHHKSSRRQDRFTPLTKTPKEILAMETVKFKAPLRHGRMYPSQEADRRVGQVRQLSHLVKEIKQRGRRGEQVKAAKKKEAPNKEKATVIFMVQPEQPITRQKVTQSFFAGREISFPPLKGNGEPENLIVIEAEVEGHLIHRMYVEGGSASEVLYEHCFNKLNPKVKNKMIPATTPLLGCSGEISWSLGQISLMVSLGDEKHLTSALMNFMVVRSSSPYNDHYSSGGLVVVHGGLAVVHGGPTVVHDGNGTESFVRPCGTTQVVTRGTPNHWYKLSDESLFEAREHYKLSIDWCLNHNILRVTQIDTFYNGLTLSHRDTINAATRGTLMKRIPEESYDLIKNMTAHHNDWDTSSYRGESFSYITSSSFEIAALTQEMAEMRKDMLQMHRSNQQDISVTPRCETCGGPHSYDEFQATGGYTQDIYATTGNYNSGGNAYQPQGSCLLSYRSNNFLGPPGFNPPNNQNHGQNYNQNISQLTYPSTDEMLRNFMISVDAKFNSLATLVIEIQKSLQERPQGVLPSNTIPNPRAYLKVITTRSGMTLAGPLVPHPHLFSSEEVQRDPKTIRVQVLTESAIRVPPLVVQPSSISGSSELPPATASDSSSMIPEKNPHQPPILYPLRLNKEKLHDKSDIQIHGFLQMFKKLHFNISFTEALAYMPKYAKMVKDLLTNKEKLLELVNTLLNENCLVVLKKLPKKCNICPFCVLNISF